MLTLSLLLLACSGADDADPHDTTSGDTSGAASLGLTYSGGECPELSDGKISDFLSGGEERSFKLLLPEDPVGAPVLFAWHWLGGRPNDTIDVFQLEDFVEQTGAIVVAPYSCCSAYEWQFIEPADDNVDLALFDDALACLDEQFGVDPDRIWATGMSAGGLWTSYLTVHRAEYLTATAPFSGGAESWNYQTPASPIPVMLTWGGPNDLYNGYSFDDASAYFSERLRADGHFVAECVHDSGHVLPQEAAEMLALFLEAHPRGAEPWADGLPEALPDWCVLPE